MMASCRIWRFCVPHELGGGACPAPAARQTNVHLAASVKKRIVYITCLGCTCYIRQYVVCRLSCNVDGTILARITAIT